MVKCMCDETIPKRKKQQDKEAEKYEEAEKLYNTCKIRVKSPVCDSVNVRVPLLACAYVSRCQQETVVKQELERVWHACKKGSNDAIYNPLYDIVCTFIYQLPPSLLFLQPESGFLLFLYVSYGTFSHACARHTRAHPLPFLSADYSEGYCSTRFRRRWCSSARKKNFLPHLYAIKLSRFAKDF